MMTANRYSVIFYLEGDDLSLIEIGRHDLGAEEDKNRLFHWLVLDGDGRIAERMTFVSMTSTPPHEHREFAQGSLDFDDDAGTFTARATNTRHALRRVGTDAVPGTVRDQIDAYLDGLPA